MPHDMQQQQQQQGVPFIYALLYVNCTWLGFDKAGGEEKSNWVPEIITLQDKRISCIYITGSAH